MAEDSPVSNTFSAIAEGYGGAQETLARLGFIPGSFLPSDRGGAAPQLPTLPPPRFATVASTTLPFPSAAPAFAGAAQAPPPAPLPPMFTSGMPMYNPSMQAAFAPPPPPQMATYSPPSFYPGMASMPPAYTRAFTDPTRGSISPVSTFSGGTTLSDLSLAGYIPRGIQLDAPGTGVNIARMQYEARSRLLDTTTSGLGTAAIAAGTGIGASLGYGVLKTAGLGLTSAAIAGGLTAGGALVAGYTVNRVNDKIEDISTIQRSMAGLTGGPLVSPLGMGIDARTANDIRKGLKSNASFSFEDYASTLSMAQESGLMRGNTGSISQIVSRVKDIAKITKSIMDLGEGITQRDAIELQTIAENMGISSNKLKTQGLATRILATARVTNQTMSSIMSGAGSEGAGLFGQAGMNMGAGMLAGISSAGIASGMVNSGKLSARELSMFGGESGLANALLSGVAGFQSGNASNLVLASLAGKGSLHSVITGGTAIGDPASQLLKQLKSGKISKQDRDLVSQFLQEKSPEILSQVQETLSPERMQMMLINQANQMMKKSDGKMTAFTAFTNLTGSETGARALMKLMQDPSALMETAEQTRASNRERDRRAIREYEEYSGIKSRAYRAYKKGVSYVDDLLGVDYFVNEFADSEAAAQAESSGLDYYGRNKRKFAGSKQAASRLSKTLSQEGIEPILNAFRRSKGKYRADDSLLTEEDYTMFGNLKNRSLAQTAFEDYGFSNSIFDNILDSNGFYSFDGPDSNPNAIGSAGRTNIFFGSGKRTAEQQQKEYARLLNQTSTGREVASIYGDFGQTTGAAAEFLKNFRPKSEGDRALYKLAERKVRSIGYEGNLMGLNRNLLDRELSDFTPEQQRNFPRLVAALMQNKRETSPGSEASLGIEAAIGKAGQLGELRLGGNFAAAGLGRFSGSGAKDTEQMKYLDDLQMAAIELGVTSKEEYDLLLRTGGDATELMSVINTTEGTAKSSAARSLLNRLEKGDESLVSGIRKSAGSLKGKIKGSRDAESLFARMSNRLSSTTEDAKNLKTIAAISSGLTDLGILQGVSGDSSETKADQALKFFETIQGMPGSSGNMMNRIAGAQSSEQVLEMLVGEATGGKGSAAKLLRSPSFAGEINPILEEIRAEAKGVSGLSQADTAELLKKKGAKLAAAIARSSQSPTASAEGDAGSLNAIEAQIKSLSEIAAMNEKAAAILQKIVGENGTAQTLTNAVNTLYQKVVDIQP